MDNIMNKNNKVSARGRIISIKRNDYGHRSLVLYIKKGANPVPLYVSFALNTDLPLSVTVNSHVKIEGHVVARIYRDEVWERSSYMQYFVADKVELDKTKIEEVFPEDCDGEGFGYAEPYMTVALKGEIAKISEAEDKSGKPRTWTRILLRGEQEKGSRHPLMVFAQYSSNMRVSDVKLHTGDKVCLVGTVSSRRKEIGKASNSKNGHKKFSQPTKTYEDIIVDDLVVIDPATPEMDSEDVVNMLMED